MTRGIVLDKQGMDLIVQASAAEVAQFALGAAVVVGAISKPTKSKPTNLAMFCDDGLLYDRHGQAVAFIRSWVQERHWVDVTTFADIDLPFVQGVPRYRIEAEGPV